MLIRSLFADSYDRLNKVFVVFFSLFCYRKPELINVYIANLVSLSSKSQIFQTIHDKHERLDDERYNLAYETKKTEKETIINNNMRQLL